MKLVVSEKELEKLNFMKIRSVGAEFFHEDGQTDKLTDRQNKYNSRFSQFYERA